MASSQFVLDAVTALSNALSTLNSDPPELIIHAGKSKQLQSIAKGLNLLFSSKEAIEITPPAGTVILAALKTFVHEITSNQVVSFSTSRDLLPNDHTEASALMEVQELHTELQSLFLENAAVTQRMNEMKRSSDQELSKVKSKCEKLQGKCRDMKDKLEIGASSKRQLKKQLEEANSEIDALNSSVSEMKTELEDVTAQCEQAEGDLRRERLRTQELETENSRMSTLVKELKLSRRTQSPVASERVYDLENRKMRLENAQSQLMSLVERQAEEIGEWSAKWKAASRALGIASQVMGEYDMCLRAQMSEIEALKKKLTKAESENHSLVEESRSVVDNDPVIEKLRYLSGEAEAQGILRYLERIEKCGDVARLVKENKTLVSLVNSQLQFLSRIVKSGEFDIALMQGQRTDVGREHDEVLTQIRRNRAFLAENGVNTSNGEISLAAVQQLCESDVLYEVIASQVTTSALMRECSEKLLWQKQVLESFIHQMGEELGVEGSSSDICTTTIQYIREEENFIAKVMKAIRGNKKEQTISNKRKYILEFAKKAANALYFLYVDVKKALEYHGDITTLPQFLLEFIGETKTKQREEAERTVTFVEDLNVSEHISPREEAKTQEYIDSLIAENEVSNTKIAEQTEEIQRLKEEMDVLQSKYNSSETKNNDYRTRYLALSATYKQVEQDLSSLRVQHKKISKSMEKKDKDFDKRMDKVLQKTKHQHEIAMQQQSESYELKISKLTEELSARTDKFEELKQRFQEAATSYEATIGKQKQIVEDMREQNDNLLKQLSDEQEHSKTESDTKHDDWLHLQSQIRLLTSEKEVLTAKIAQLNEKCSKITSTRDHYWETQFAAREDELRKEWKLDITELEARHRNFVHDIAQFLTDTLHKEISADELLIKTGLNQLRAQADALGNHVKLLQKRIADNQSDVWEQWARGLFSSVSDGAIFTESAGELRYLLNELVSASSANRAIIRKLESLRKQKKILQSGSIYTIPKAPRTSIQSLICFAMSMSRLRRKPTHKPTFTL